MKLLTFEDEGALKLGLVTERGVLNVAAAANALGETGVARTPTEFYAQGTGALPGLQRLADAALREGGDWHQDEDQLRLGPSVPQPQKIICVGLNYARHAKESGMELPTSPVLFSKFNNSLAGHEEDVPLPKLAEEYDYEVELAVVIGREARNVPVDEAYGYVLGYSTSNDVSARELQMRTSQWLLGKALDKFLPLGPYLVTHDEVRNPDALDVKCWLNGELRQDSNTADMIFSVPELISYISGYMTLLPGDVICTGTPEGVILGMQEKTWIKPGDVVSVEVAGLGKLTNKFVSGE